jgi:hypothetical protein
MLIEKILLPATKTKAPNSGEFGAFVLKPFG